MSGLRSVAVVGVSALFAGLAGMLAAFAQDARYAATLAPFNSTTTGSDAAAQASFITIGDQLTIRITATGVPPSMEHLQHFHGFVDNDQQSKCPVADNDLNGDGVIDIKETEARAGTTVVPFQGDPVGMEVVADTYPTADAGGTYSYEKTVPLQALQEAFASKFGGQQLDLDRRVVFLHGVPPATVLPATVESLGELPAQVTIPIAWGEIHEAAKHL